MPKRDSHLRRPGMLTMLALLMLASPVAATNIFVAKLNFSTSSESLREAFEQFGAVSSAKVITDQQTGRSKGYGFVDMPNDEEARAAVSALDGSDLDGNTLVVKVAEPRESSGASRPGGGGGFGGNRPGAPNGGWSRPASAPPTLPAQPAAPPAVPQPPVTPPAPAPIEPKAENPVAGEDADDAPGDADTESFEAMDPADEPDAILEDEGEGEEEEEEEEDGTIEEASDEALENSEQMRAADAETDADSADGDAEDQSGDVAASADEDSADADEESDR